MLRASNVAIPCDFAFNGRLNPGFNLLLNGFLPHGSDGFTISFNCGHRRPGFPEPDTAFMINPRISQCAVVRNSKLNGAWGPEERQGTFFFANGHYFTVSVSAEAYSFKISINGNYLAEFKYRVALNRITALVIEGNVTISEITTGGVVTPVQMSSFVRGRNVLPAQPFPLHVQHPAIPCTVQIPNNLKVGLTFIIQGRVNHGAKVFGLNWLCTNGDYALHLNPRLNEKAVVRNTRQGKKWGPEERSIPYFPFHPSAEFDVTVTAMANCFNVQINGQQFCTYNHRIYPINAISSFLAQGDLTITYITIKQ